MKVKFTVLSAGTTVALSTAVFYAVMFVSKCFCLMKLVTLFVIIINPANYN